MFDPLERELRIVRVVVDQRIETGGVEFRCDETACENGLHLGPKYEAIRETREIERLDSEPVARRDELLLCLVVEQESELAPQMLKAAKTIFLIEIKDDLGIALRPEAIAFALERNPDSFEIVNLAIRCKDEAPILAFQRLCPGREINDGKTRVSKRDCRPSCQRTIPARPDRDGAEP